VCGDWSVTTKVSLAGTGTNYTQGGIFLSEDIVANPSTADIRFFGVLYATTNEFQVRVLRCSAYNSFTSNQVNVNTMGHAALYFRIRRISTNYFYDMSSDGLNWMQMYTETAPFTVARMGLCTNNPGSVGKLDTVCYFRFWRQSSITTNDQPLLGRFSATQGEAGPPGIATVTDTSTVDLTLSGSDLSASVKDSSITYAKMQNMSAASLLLGRGAGAGSGVPQEITLGTNLSMSSTTLNAAGSVSSVALTAPSFLSVAGSPVTGSGTLALSLASQSGSTVFAAPNAASGTPSFRSLIANELGGSKVRAYRSGAGYSLTSGTSAVIQYDAETEDALNEFGSFVFVPITSGYYWYHLHVTVSGTISRYILDINVSPPGSILRRLMDVSASISVLDTSGAVELTAGNSYYFSVTAFGSGLSLNNGESNTNMSIRRFH